MIGRVVEIESCNNCRHFEPFNMLMMDGLNGALAPIESSLAGNSVASDRPCEPVEIAGKNTECDVPEW
jgi:hypothetical protein